MSSNDFKGESVFKEDIFEEELFTEDVLRRENAEKARELEAQRLREEEMRRTLRQKKQIAFNKEYVVGYCDCHKRRTTKFWIPRDLLKRSEGQYLCPFCGLKQKYSGV